MSERFRALLAVYGGSQLGDGFYQVALPLAVLASGGGPSQLALALLASRLAWVVLALPAGALVDRVDKRLAMMIPACARVVVSLALAAGLVIGTLSFGVFVSAALVLGTCEVVFDTAIHSVTPEVVPPEELERANGRLQTTETVANQMAGPGLGGLLAAASVAWAFGAVALLTAAAALAALRLGSIPAHRRPEQPTTIVQEIHEGLRGLVQNRRLMVYAVAGSAMNAAFAAILAGLPSLIVSPHGWGRSPALYGLMLSAAGAGGATAGLAAERIVARLGAATAIAGGGLLVALGFLLPAVTTNAPLLACGMFVTGSIVFTNIVTVSYRQRTVPRALLGRVTAAYRLLVYGGLPAGSAIAAVCAGIDLRLVFLVAPVLVLLASSATAWAARSTVRPTAAPLPRHIEETSA